MTFIESVRHVLSNYANFKGRACRSEYWWFILFYVLVQMACALLDAMLFPGTFGLIGGLATLALLIPNIAVGARRLHDTDRSGWWQLLALIPLLGYIILIVLMIRRGTEGDNRFGEPPLASASLVQS